MKKGPDKKLILIILGLVSAFVFLTLFIVNIRSGSQSQQATQKVGVTLPTGEKMSLDSTGQFVYKSQSGDSYSALWSRDQVGEFINYLRERYSASWGDDIQVLSDDELFLLIASGIVSLGEAPAGQSPTATTISQVFSTPTPNPTGGSGSTPPSGGGSGGSSGGGQGSGGVGQGGGGGWQAPSWCRIWKLSYCADAITPSPGPTQSPTPTGLATPLPPLCTNPGNQTTGRTVIGNELCIPIE